MQYEAFLKNDKGEITKTFKMNSLDTSEVYYSNVPEDFRFPRVLSVRNEEDNEEDNEDFYEKLLQCVGKTVRLESDKVNGVFDINLNNEEIVLKEVLKKENA